MKIAQLKCSITDALHRLETLRHALELRPSYIISYEYTELSYCISLAETLQRLLCSEKVSILHDVDDVNCCFASLCDSLSAYRDNAEYDVAINEVDSVLISLQQHIYEQLTF